MGQDLDEEQPRQAAPAPTSARFPLTRADLYPLGAVAGGALLATLAPFVLRPVQFVSRTAGAVMLAIAFHCLWLLFRTGERKADHLHRTDRCTPVVCLVILLIWTVGPARTLGPHRLHADDYDYLTAARQSSPSVLAYLFAPYNEHLCVGTRLLMLGIAPLDDDSVLVAARWWARFALLVNGVLLGGLIWRTVGGPAVAAGFAAFLFGRAHLEVCNWLSASQWLIGSALALAACHIALRGTRTSVWIAALLCSLALLNYSVSLVGTLWCAALLAARGQRNSVRIVLLAAAASLVVVGAIVLPPAVRAADYGGASFFEGVAPLQLMDYLARLPADLIVGYVPGLAAVSPLRPIFAVAVSFGVIWASWVAGRRLTAMHGPLLLKAVALLLCGYVVPLALRSWMPYRVLVTSGRYHWWPHLAFCLLLSISLAMLTDRSSPRFRVRIGHVVHVLALAYAAASVIFPA